MKTVVVTGGLGFVGVHVINQLLKNGYHVVAIDICDFFRREQFINYRDNFELIYKNLKDPDLFDRLPKKADYIIHLAAVPHVDYSYYYENETIENNFFSLKNILDYARMSYAKVLFSSSVEVYGGVEDKVYKETDCLHPKSIYGYSKLMCEELIKYYIDNYNIDCTILRLTNLYGSAQLPDRIIPRNICRLMDNLSFDLTSDFYRDFLYVEDAAVAILKMLKSGICGEIYNLSSGKSYNMRTIANRVLELFEGADVLSFDSNKTNNGRGRHLKIDCQKIASNIDCYTETDLMIGLESTVAWYKHNWKWCKQFSRQYRSLRESSAFIIDSHYIHKRINTSLEQMFK